MSDQNKAVVHRFIEEIINTGGRGPVEDLMASDLVWHGGSVGDYHDLASFLQGVGPIFAAFPDLHVELQELASEGDLVTARYTWQGTQQGDFLGIQPTHKPVTVTGISIYRIADGKIVEEWWQEDLLGLMQQLSAAPAPAS
jgi:predicted ester cyclase